MKPFPARKQCSLLQGELAQPSFRTARRLAFLAAVVITSSTFVLAQAGQLDSTFGTGGIFTTNFTQTDATMASAVAIQSDGKIVRRWTTTARAAPLWRDSTPTERSTPALARAAS